MALPLREPFFLRGKQSWRIRAIWTSLTLGGVGFVSGTIWFGGACLLADSVANDLISQDGVLAIVAGAAGLILVAITIPFSRWLGWSWAGLLCRGLWMTCVPMTPWLVALLAQQDSDQLYRDLHDSIESVFGSDAGLLALLFAPLWLAWSTAWIRPWKLFPVLVSLSFLSVPLTLFMFGLAEQLTELYRSWLSWLPMFDLMEMLILFSVGGQFFATLLIPWGLPFWWPAVVANTPDDAAGSRVSASAFSARDGLGT